VASWSPIKLRNPSKQIVFEGESSGGGGGSQPVLGDYLGVGGYQTIADGASAALPIQFSDGTELLDLTDPTAPTILEDGTYAWFVQVQCFDPALTDGGCAEVQLNTPYVGPIVILPGGITTVQTTLAGSVNLVYNFDAGDVLNVIVHNDDGAVERAFIVAYYSLVKLA